MGKRNISGANLCHEHGSRRNLHVMTKLEIFQEGDTLFHANVSVHFKAYVSNRKSWVQVANDIFCYHIEAWCLLAKENIMLENNKLEQMLKALRHWN